MLRDQFHDSEFNAQRVADSLDGVRLNLAFAVQQLRECRLVNTRSARQLAFGDALLCDQSEDRTLHFSCEVAHVHASIVARADRFVHRSTGKIEDGHGATDTESVAPSRMKALGLEPRTYGLKVRVTPREANSDCADRPIRIGNSEQRTSCVDRTSHST